MFGSVIKVWALAVASAVPLGPVGLSIIRYTLSHGVSYGFFGVIGAISADLLYALLAAFGASLLVDFLTSYEAVISLLGGVLLTSLGLYFLKHPPSFDGAGKKADVGVGLYAPMVTTFLLTLANPMTLFAFLGIFSVTVTYSMGFWDQLFLVFALVFGSFSWWVFLVIVLHLARARVSHSLIIVANFFAGCLVSGIGLFIILRALNCFIQAFAEGGFCFSIH